MYTLHDHSRPAILARHANLRFRNHYFRKLAHKNRKCEIWIFSIDFVNDEDHLCSVHLYKKVIVYNGFC